MMAMPRWPPCGFGRKHVSVPSALAGSTPASQTSLSSPAREAAAGSPSRRKSAGLQLVAPRAVAGENLAPAAMTSSAVSMRPGSSRIARARTSRKSRRCSPLRCPSRHQRGAHVERSRSRTHSGSPSSAGAALPATMRCATAAPPRAAVFSQASEALASARVVARLAASAFTVACANASLTAEHGTAVPQHQAERRKARQVGIVPPSKGMSISVPRCGAAGLARQPPGASRQPSLRSCEMASLRICALPKD